MQLNFSTVSEPTTAGAKWNKLFNTFWPGYRTWFLSKDTVNTPDLQTSQDALKKYMPKMWSTYEHLCTLTNADPVIARFLTGFQPPAYISACAQAVIKADEIQLVRNYDYHPDLLEGTILLSKWNDHKVMGTSDCLIGIVDGMNDSGLCVSLTFGGRKEVGYGFGIPFILRYVLEFCTNTAEAVNVLKGIPSHMSYNVTIVDKTGASKTVQLAPDKAPLVTNDSFATNHQGEIDWPENAQFNQTIKRYNFIKNYLKSKNISANELAKAFLHSPLYNTKFTEGFGTLYTSVYQPENLLMKVLWPSMALERSFDNFAEENILIQYNSTMQPVIPSNTLGAAPVESNEYRWQDAVVDSLVNGMAGKKTKQKQKELRDRLMPGGEIAWEVVVDYWNEPVEY
ncbi:C45 family autoproteolytic acyltransferase/hydolase [Maribacter sp. ACAM166]|uniref:C45 family autoproteolytic acyltransferase/hydolase n=1 Tax=Maribacter sp. ACAM166 TaxID=2508996 RepID=UPI0010FCE37E|nr:C45 family peptidase [Maribacter sp. ACAM166]TLP80164.1 acyl-CoA--6-aminopenicillanic acid acyltransferase [Maribacter sp. ACAM166]